MSILTSTKEPYQAQAILAGALATLYRADAHDAPLRQLNPDNIRYGAHHAVYELDPEAIAKGARLEAARRTGSRWLLMEEHEVRAAIEIEMAPDGLGAGAFRSINAGPFVDATVAALHLAETARDAGHYEFALLRVTPLRLWILWFKPLGAGVAPQFRVLDPAPPEFHTDAHYDERELFNLLLPLARAATQPGADDGLVG